MKNITAKAFDRSPENWWFVMLLGAAVLLFIVPAPAFPEATIDGAWALAAEQASRSGAVFGRDFVFTYGPFAFLATGLFQPETFVWVLLSSLVIGICWLGPLLASRRVHVAGLYLMAIPVVILRFDARIVSALLAVCLLSMMRPSRWSIGAAAVWGVIALSKLSFALVALPLMILTDLYGILAWRRLPLQTPTFLLVFMLGLSASGTGPALWSEAARNDGSIISAYSGAMQLILHLGGIAALLGTLATLAMAIILFVWIIWSQHASSARSISATFFPILAIAWCLWMSFKMGFVRSDEHMVITWAALAMSIPAIIGTLESRSRLSTTQRIGASGLMVIVVFCTIGLNAKTMATPERGPKAVFANYLNTLAMRPALTLSWLTPSGWHAAATARTDAENRIRRIFNDPAGTTADVVPYQLAPVIFSNLTYRPRPVPQSYSSYTPHLQRLDARHFASSGSAPELLFMDVFSEIDERLPTLSLGPSLPIIAQWYDVIGTDPLGAKLKRRETARSVHQTSIGARTIQFGEWINLPRAPSTSLTTAEITVPRGVLARVTGLLAREPVIFVELRAADHSVVSYQFVPGMAEAGVVMSPMVRNPTWLATIPDRAIGLVSPGSRPGATIPITAIRFGGDPLARYAYGPPTVRFRIWEFPADTRAPSP